MFSVYALLRFLHIVVAIFAIGPHFVAPILLKQIVRQPESAGTIFPILIKVTNLPKNGGPVMLISGLLMIWLSGRGWAMITEPWLAASLVLFLFIIIYGRVKGEPIGKKLGTALAQGSIKAEEIKSLARQLNATLAVMGVCLALLTTLMITRPTF